MIKWIATAVAGVVIGVLGWVAWPAPDVTAPTALDVQAPTGTVRGEGSLPRTSDEMLGQLLMIGIPGTTVNSGTRALLEEIQPGGVILFKRNITSPTQVKALIDALQASVQTPLFIAVDQEGGQVTRLPFLKQTAPQSAINTVEEATRVGEARAKELRALGITMNFSPVLDVVTKKTSYLYPRTFGLVGPEKTGELGAALVRASGQAGVLSVAKHYPSYGDIALDPHQKEVILRATTATRDAALLPFRRVIDADPDAPLMLAHIIIPEVDALPATRSPKQVAQVRALGAKGVLVTDDLEMVSAGVPADQAAEEAILSGVDLAMVAHSPALQRAALARLRQAQQEGRLPAATVDAALERILRAKKRVGLLQP